MKLTEAKRLFMTLRQQGRIHVEEHAYLDYPKRAFDYMEVLSLVRERGRLQDTQDNQFKGERFLWFTKDVDKEKVRLVVTFDRTEDGQEIIVVSAWRKDKC